MVPAACLVLNTHSAEGILPADLVRRLHFAGALGSPVMIAVHHTPAAGPKPNCFVGAVAPRSWLVSVEAAAGRLVAATGTQSRFGREATGGRNQHISIPQRSQLQFLVPVGPVNMRRALRHRSLGCILQLLGAVGSIAGSVRHSEPAVPIDSAFAERPFGILGVLYETSTQELTTRMRRSFSNVPPYGGGGGGPAAFVKLATLPGRW